MRMAMRMVVIMREPSLLAGLEDVPHPTIINPLTFQHLLDRKIVRHEHTCFAKGGFEMQIANHPANPGGFLHLAQSDQQAVFGTLLNHIGICLCPINAIPVRECFAYIKAKIATIRRRAAPTTPS